MTAEQAAQLIDHTLEHVEQRCALLEQGRQSHDRSALEEEFREWAHPRGSHIDLMLCPC
ncbi:hypothetical protein [Synechococcus sp. RSCCF101]|uniref:hypothetical protein n=1 Tax=Synechococcus sp. RSCCF101 TaxID=2511069 RepID=UPI00177A9894|nr:hypothetical protein [Synechococcus sp. RSCCF101]